MKLPRLRSTAVVIGSAVFFVTATAVYAAQKSADKTTMQEVKQKMVDAADVIKDYSADQRDEAIDKVKATLDDLDARIDRLQTRIDSKWDQMNQAARQEAKATLKGLKEKRNEVAEWYGGLKYSSSAAWEDVKKGFSTSYKALQDAFDKAASEF
jgi:chromosome segregation ATPase